MPATPGRTIAAAGAVTPRHAAPGAPDELELRRLRRDSRRQELTIEHLLEAVLTLRRGVAALRAENRELHAELQRRRSGAPAG